MKKKKKLSSIIVDRRREAERWVAARRHVIIGFFRGHDLKERMSKPWVAIEKGCGWSWGFWNFGGVSRASISPRSSRDGSYGQRRESRAERKRSGGKEEEGADTKSKEVKSKKWKARMIKLRRRKRS